MSNKSKKKKNKKKGIVINIVEGLTDSRVRKMLFGEKKNGKAKSMFECIETFNKKKKSKKKKAKDYINL